MNILIVGCGKVGSRVASLLTHENHQVYGLSRSGLNLPARVQPVSIDLTHPISSADLPSNITHIVTSIAPNSREIESYKAVYDTGLANLYAAIDKSKLKKVVHLSSTSVYPNQTEHLTTESSPTCDQSPFSQILLKSESHSILLNCDYTIIRAAGIYGPSRQSFLTAVLNGTKSPTPAPFTNRIHEDDLVRLIVHVLQMQNTPKILNACDDLSAPMDEVVEQLVQMAENNGFTIQASDKTFKMRANKKISNALLKQIDFKLGFSTFKKGYRQMLFKR
jgi:nucleoside-diphosphate-sugar epimerase